MGRKHNVIMFSKKKKSDQTVCTVYSHFVLDPHCAYRYAFCLYTRTRGTTPAGSTQRTGGDYKIFFLETQTIGKTPSGRAPMLFRYTCCLLWPLRQLLRSRTSMSQTPLRLGVPQIKPCQLDVLCKIQKAEARHRPPTSPFM